LLVVKFIDEGQRCVRHEARVGRVHPRAFGPAPGGDAQHASQTFA
jgi:hypothetical protein